MSQNGNGKAVAHLSDDLIAKARAIASRSDELLELLEDARQRLLKSDARTEPGKAGRPSPKRRFKPSSDEKPKAAEKTKTKPQEELSEGLRLLTSQMSASGASRGEIAQCLREDFGIEDPERILKSMGL